MKPKPRFLIDADLPLTIAPLIRASGYDAVDVREIGLRHASDDSIAAHAQGEGLAVFSGDGDFGDVLRYPPERYKGLVVLDLRPDDTRERIENLVRAFLKLTDVIDQVEGRLVIVEHGRVRIRPRLVRESD